MNLSNKVGVSNSGTDLIMTPLFLFCLKVGSYMVKILFSPLASDQNKIEIQTHQSSNSIWIGA